MDVQGPYRVGAVFLLIGAALQMAALAVGGGQALALLLGGSVVSLVLAFGLLRTWRWLAYAAFLLAMAGAIVAMALAQTGAGLFGLAMWGAVAANAAAACGLFVSLWKSRARGADLA